MLRFILASHDKKVLASIDNYNSRVGSIGILSSLNPNYDAAIIEVAQSALWMRRGPITRLIRPNIAVITSVDLSQTSSGVRSIEDAAKWKSRIFDGLTGAKIAIIGEHLPCYDYIYKEALLYANEIITYGYSDTCDLIIKKKDKTSDGCFLDLIWGKDRTEVFCSSLGEGAIQNMGACIAVLLGMGLRLDEISHSLNNYRPRLQARLERFSVALGTGTFEIIDDSYNAEISSMKNSLSILKELNVMGRKVAVLGRVVHLGDLAAELHRSLKDSVLQSKADIVITHGEEMLALREVLPKKILGPHFKTAQDIVLFLKAEAQTGDLVLLKGSRRDSDFGEVGELLGKYKV